ncbi:MAG: PIN domain-containing protein [Planctomycetota bacterium]
MKTVIVDTNILFSALLGKSKKFRDVLLTEKSTTFYSCKFVIVELFKHKEKIQKYSSLEEDEILELLYGLLKRINLFDEDSVTIESRQKAYDLCKDIDEKDIPHLSITIELDGLLWTSDKTLREGLAAKGFDSFFDIE